MKRSITFYAAIAFSFLALPVFAQQYNSDENTDLKSAPAGMESKKVNNDVSVLMPQGGKMYKRNKSTYIMESADEYAGRKFAGMDERMAKLEKDVQELKGMLNEIITKLNATSNAGRGSDSNVSTSAKE
jgi:hypothetical protein